MSAFIWTQCGGKSNLVVLTMEVWRIVEDQHRSSTMKLVDNTQEHAILEDIIERGKPRYPYPPYNQTLHYLLWTPFRYPPLKNGSRFGARTEISIWYGAAHYHTAFAEKAYYRFFFRQGLTQQFPVSIEDKYTAFSVAIRTDQGIQLHLPPFCDHHDIIESPVNYKATQELGRRMREDGVEAFFYTSARDPNKGLNTGIFHPSVFANIQPQKEKIWHLFETDKCVRFYRAAPGEQESIEFIIQQFFVEGQFPEPVN